MEKLIQSSATGPEGTMWILEILLVIVDLIGGVIGLDRKGRGEKQPVLRERKEQPYKR